MAATQVCRTILTVATLLATWFALARSAVASAADVAVVASLAVTGPPDCAARADVVRRVARRSARIRFDDGVATGPALTVVVEGPAAGGALTASLSFAWPNGTRAARQLSAPTCPALADAIALVAVLALDPAAASARAPSAPEARPVAIPAPPRRTAAVRTPAAETPPPPPSMPSSATPVPPEAPAAQVPPPPPSPPADKVVTPPPPPPESLNHAPAAAEPPPVYSLDIGAAFRVAYGPAPLLMPGLALAGSWQRDTASILSLKVQLVAAHHGRDGWTNLDGTADFTLDLLALHLCALRLGTSPVELRVCGSASAGRIVGEGTASLDPHRRSRLFATAGVAALLAVTVHPRWQVTASVEPQTPLIRDQFAFGPNVFYRVPPMMLFFGVGLTVTFP